MADTRLKTTASRALGTPAPGSSNAAPGSGTPTRKPRQNLDERDHILMVTHCWDRRDDFSEGSKSSFWNAVGDAFKNDTGKVLAQMSATVGRLVEGRRRQLADWNQGIIPQKPGGELNDMLDKWILVLRESDAAAEEEKMRQVDSKRRAEMARKERRSIPGDGGSFVSGPVTSDLVSSGGGTANGRANMAAEIDSRPAKRRRYMEKASSAGSGPGPAQNNADAGPHENDRHAQITAFATAAYPPPAPTYPVPAASRAAYPSPYTQAPTNSRPPPQQATPAPPQQQIAPQAQMQGSVQAQQHPYPSTITIANALTKEDWRDVMGADARLRALETKVDRVETMIGQNNKMLLQLVRDVGRIAGRRGERDTEGEEDTEGGNLEGRRLRIGERGGVVGTVHLDEEFERDYL